MKVMIELEKDKQSTTSTIYHPSVTTYENVTNQSFLNGFYILKFKDKKILFKQKLIRWISVQPEEGEDVI